MAKKNKAKLGSLSNNALDALLKLNPTTAPVVPGITPINPGISPVTMPIKIEWTNPDTGEKISFGSSQAKDQYVTKWQSDKTQNEFLNKTFQENPFWQYLKLNDPTMFNKYQGNIGRPDPLKQYQDIVSKAGEYKKSSTYNYYSQNPNAKVSLTTSNYDPFASYRNRRNYV